MTTDGFRKRCKNDTVKILGKNGDGEELKRRLSM